MQANAEALTSFLDTLYLAHTAPQDLAGLPSTATLAQTVSRADVKVATQRRIVITGAMPSTLPPHVEDIAAEGCGLAAVPAMLLVPSVTRLQLANNKITRLPALDACVLLTTLELPGNRLTSFAAVPTLRRLDLRANRLTVCPPFAAMPLLEFVDLSDNLIT